MKSCLKFMPVEYRFSCRRARVVSTEPLFDRRPFVSVAVERGHWILHEALRNLAHDKSMETMGKPCLAFLDRFLARP